MSTNGPKTWRSKPETAEDYKGSKDRVSTHDNEVWKCTTLLPSQSHLLLTKELNMNLDEGQGQRFLANFLTITCEKCKVIM